MEIIFEYQKQEKIFPCNLEPLKDLCKKFAEDKSLDINKLFFYYKGQEINLNENDIINKLFNENNQVVNPNEISDISNTPKKITIKVFTAPFAVKFIFGGSEYQLIADKTDLMQNVLEEWAEELKVEVKEIYFLKDGSMSIYEKLGNIIVDEFANKFDKENKTISILIYDYDRNTEEEQTKIFQNKPVEVEITEYPNMFKINFTYLDAKYYIYSQNTDKMKKVFADSQKKGSFKVDNVFFIYKGKLFFYNEIGDNITVNDFANNHDKKRKEMEIQVNRNNLKDEDIDEEVDEKSKNMLKTIVKEYDKEERHIYYDQSSVFDEEEEKKIKEKSEIVSNILTNPNLNNIKSVYNEEEKKKIKEKSEIDILNNYNINNSNINNQIKENPFHIIFFLKDILIL